jgi:hypothetical protein
MILFEFLKQEFRAIPKNWFVTGVFRFLASNLLDALFKLERRIVRQDSCCDCRRHSVNEVQMLIVSEQRSIFRFINSYVRELKNCGQYNTFAIDNVRP